MYGGGSGSHCKEFVSDSKIVYCCCYYYCYVEVDENEQFAGLMWTVVRHVFWDVHEVHIILFIIIIDLIVSLRIFYVFIIFIFISNRI